MRRLGRYWGVLALLFVVVGGCRPAVRKARWLDQGHRFKPTGDAVIASPALWDWNQDDVLEIAVGSWDGYFYVLDANLSDMPGWPKWSRRGFFSSPTLADLDGDGTPEILVGSDVGKLFAWRWDGTSVEGFPVDLGYTIWASPTVFGQEPYIAIGGESWLYVLDARGQAIDGWPRPIEGWPDATVAATSELLAVTTLTPGDPSQGWIYAWSLDGEVLPGFPVALEMDSDSSPALVDLDGDGEMWIVFGDDAGWLHVIDTAGHERPGFPVKTIGPSAGPTPTPHPPGGNVYSIEASPAVADLDADGRFEIVVGSWDARLYVWDDAGASLPGWPVAVGDQIISSAALVDLDGDDRLDLIVGSKDQHLYGWTMDARPLPGFPIDLGAPVFSSPWVGDLERDGRADIVVGSNRGVHVIHDVGVLGRAAWPMFHRDRYRRGVVP
jgi:hypothetical protein